MGVGYSAKPAPALALYHGKTDQEAARGLLELALEQAEDGRRARIGVARVYYLGGFKAEGPAIFEEVLAGKHDRGDGYLIARGSREIRRAASGERVGQYVSNCLVAVQSQQKSKSK